MNPSNGRDVGDSRDARVAALESGRLLTVGELSRYLSLPKPTIYTWTCLRRFPPGAVVRLGRALRFDKDVIDAMVDAGRERPIT